MEYRNFFSSFADRLRPNAIRALSYLVNRPGITSFAGGVPSPQTFPIEPISEIASRLVSEKGAQVLQYGVTRGDAKLIEQICEYLSTRSIKTKPEEILLTTGSQQGLDLASHIFIEPGDVVIVESPSYIGGICSLRNTGAEFVSVKMQEDGIDLVELETTINNLRRDGRRVKLLYTIPSFQNPSGITLSAEKRKQLLSIATEYDFVIFEDDPYAELFFAQEKASEPIKSFDQEGRVVYFGSFSKVLAPGLRTAWVVAPTEVAKKLELAKESADLCSSLLDQAIVSECYATGLLHSRLPQLRDFYRVRCNAMLSALQQHAPSDIYWTKPTGGLFVWIELEGSFAKLSATKMLEKAVENGVAYVPGLPFFVEQRPDTSLRLAFSKESPESIESGIAKLCSLIAEEVRSTT